MFPILFFRFFRFFIFSIYIYSMNININYTFSLEVLLLIFILYFILISNTFCSCCNISKIIEIMKTSLNNPMHLHIQ